MSQQQQQLWYVTKNGQQAGPYTVSQLKELADSGQLQPSDLLWTEGWNEWKPVSSTALGKHITQRPAGTPPPPPPSSLVVTTHAPQSYGYRQSGGGKVFIAVMGIVLFASFFVPWWGITIREEESEFERPTKPNKNVSTLRNPPKPMDFEEKVERTRDMYNVLEKYETWYEDNIRARRGLISGKNRSTWVWGWQPTAGIVAFIISFFIIPLGIVPLCVPYLRNWSWSASFLAAGLAIPIFITALVWWITAPWEDVEPLMSQGSLPGPYINLVASLLLLIIGVTDGATGLKRFLAARPKSA